MARLRTQVLALSCTPRGQSYFRNGLRPYLLATLESPWGIGLAEYSPLPGIHDHTIYEAKAMLDALSQRELDMLLALDQSLDYSKLAKIFKNHWPYPLSWILSSLFYSLTIATKNILDYSKIKLSGLILGDLREADYYINNNYNCLKIKISTNIREEIIKINKLKILCLKICSYVLMLIKS